MYRFIDHRDATPDERAAGLGIFKPRPVRFPVIDGHRICTKCLENKPVNQYGRAIHRNDGYEPTCRACKSARRRQK